MARGGLLAHPPPSQRLAVEGAPPSADIGAPKKPDDGADGAPEVGALADEVAAGLAKRLRDLAVRRHDFTVEAVRAQVEQWRADPGLAPSAYINLGNANGKTALHFAAQLREDGLAEFFIDLGADVHRSTARGHTPLIYAAGRAREATVLRLLEARASCRVRTANGDTALGMASGRLGSSMVEVLQRAEAAEMGEWQDFTEDARAVAAQADHVERCPHCASWEGDIPPAVADVLDERRKAKAKTSAHEDGLVEALATELGGTPREAAAFAAALLQAAAALPKRRAVAVLRRALLATPRGEGGAEAQCLFLVRIALAAITDVPRRLAAEAEGAAPGAEAEGRRRGRAARRRGGAASKEARLQVTSALLASLKEILPGSGVRPGVVAVEAPPWMTIEVFGRPELVDLARDAGVFADVLRRLCHENAWGSDFASAVKWLRLVDPASRQAGGGGAGRGAADTAAFNSLADVFLEMVLVACRKGNSLRRHLRDNSSLIDQLRETMGEEAGALIARACDEAPAAAAAAVVRAPEALEAVPRRAGSVPVMGLPEGFPVTLVDDAAGWSAAQRRLAAASVVAVDTEWWDVGAGPALVQIAVGAEDGGDASECFLLDTLRAPRVLAAGLRDIFDRRDLLVLGWSFGEDQKRLRELMSAHGGDPAAASQEPLRVADLQPPVCQLLNASSSSSLVSLSGACAQILGARLDKSEQCSYWNRRPLSDAQVAYAALDAVVLLRLWAGLRRRGFAVCLNGTSTIASDTEGSPTAAEPLHKYPDAPPHSQDA